MNEKKIIRFNPEQDENSTETSYDQTELFQLISEFEKEAGNVALLLTQAVSALQEKQDTSK